MILQEGSALVDFERFLVRYLNKIKEKYPSLRKIPFRRDDENTHKEAGSVVVQILLDDGIETESLAPDNFLFTYCSRASFYHAHEYPGNLFKRTGILHDEQLPFEDAVYVISCEEDQHLHFQPLVFRNKEVLVNGGFNQIEFPENYYPNSSQLWFRGAKEEGVLVQDSNGRIEFTSPFPTKQYFYLHWLEIQPSYKRIVEPSNCYYDLIPGVIIETSESLEYNDRVLFRLTKGSDPVYDVYGAICKCRVRLTADPLGEVSAKRYLGHLMNLAFILQQEIIHLDIPVEHIAAKIVTDEADASRDRQKKAAVEFDTQFQFEYFVPIQRYLRDIRLASFQELELPPRMLFLKGDSI